MSSLQSVLDGLFGATTPEQTEKITGAFALELRAQIARSGQDPDALSDEQKAEWVLFGLRSYIADVYRKYSPGIKTAEQALETAKEEAVIQSQAWVTPVIDHQTEVTGTLGPGPHS